MGRIPYLAKGVFRRCAVGVSLGLAAAISHSSPLGVPTASGTTGDMVLFPGPLPPLTSPDGAPLKASKGAQPFGWNMPGRHYRGGSGWWALVCGASESHPEACQLQATKLRVDDARHAAYDSEAVASQWLRWTPLIDNENTVMVFKPIRSLAKLPLSAGPVTSYLHNGMPAYPKPPGPGSLEVRIPMGAGHVADLVPRVYGMPGPGRIGATQNPAGDPYSSFDVLELRVGERRQRLPGQWSGCSSGVVRKPTDFLWWAGDLDRDGQLDLILSYDASQHLVLYLSSQAKDDQLVGEAGAFEFVDPAQSEC